MDSSKTEPGIQRSLAKNDSDLVLFVARILPGEEDTRTFDMASQNLLHTELLYAQRYGRLSHPSMSRVIIHPRSDLPLKPNSSDAMFFNRVLASIRAKDDDLTLVLIGWSALTTDPLTFVSMFNKDADNIRLVVYDFLPDAEAKIFYEANVAQV